MAITPDLIVYMWMVPALLFFVFPFLFLPLILRGEKSPIAVRQASGERASSSRSNKREYSRQKIDGIIAQVSDGVRCCRGSITDISKSGVCLVSPKDGLDRNADKLGVLLTGAGESFHMRIKPRWKQEHGGELSIGATIEETLGSMDSLVKIGNGRQMAGAA